MKIFEAKNDENPVDELLHMLEKHTEQKIFTMRVLDHTKRGLEVLVVFEDKSVMQGVISVQGIGGSLAMGVQGNFI